MLSEKYIQYEQERCDQNPIYEIMLFENQNKEMISDTGIPLGFPDIGNSYTAGFYYELETAINALNENWCDIRETCYDAAFVLCRFPGIDNCVGTDGRIYFIYDQSRDGYFQTDEPEIFRQIAY